MVTRHTRWRARDIARDERPKPPDENECPPASTAETRPTVVLRILAVRFVGRVDHEHLVELRWRDVRTGKDGSLSRQAMVDLLAGAGSVRAIVVDDLGPVEVKVVNAEPPYLQAFADGTPTDNLLWLPKY